MRIRYGRSWLVRERCTHPDRWGGCSATPGIRCEIGCGIICQRSLAEIVVRDETRRAEASVSIAAERFALKRRVESRDNLEECISRAETEYEKARADDSGARLCAWRQVRHALNRVLELEES